MYPDLTPTMLRDLRELIDPEPLIPVPMTARQLRDAVREMLPETASVQVDTSCWCVAGRENESTALMIRMRSNEALWICNCTTCEQALDWLKANVELLRFGDVSVRCG